ncbi:MAG TPA: hypothetical protein VN684_00565 [Terriglobales bacterium]|nr:hypothetical protein [Terriglobales bacterium]
MRRKFWLFPLILILIFVPCSYAQLWNGILSSNRAVDWSNAGIPGGVPSGSWAQCGSTIAAGASAATINSALASCSANHYVLLGAGTFNLSSGITFNGKSNIELRGAGADQTLLKFSGSVSCNGLGASICIDGSNSSPNGEQHTASWTAGYAKGTTTLTLSSTSGIVANQTLLILDQLDDASDTGGVFVCEQEGLCSNDGPGGAARTDGSPSGPRSQQQEVLVTGVSGNQVTISPGLYMPNWRSSQSPGAFWATSYASQDGVQNLSVDSSASPNSESGVLLFGCNQCWVQGIRSIVPTRNHVWIYQSVHSDISNNYFYGTQNYASTSYGVEQFIGSDNLIENNIFQRVTAPMMNGGSTSGVVWGYNYTINDYYDPVSPNWLQPGMYLHAAGQDNMLFEGNISSGFIADNVHGTHNFITMFRNQSLGWEQGQSEAKTGQTDAVQAYAFSRYFNIIGNVLGKSGYDTGYMDAEQTGGASGNSSIYVLGWSGNGGASDSSCCVNDPNVKSTIMLWGNYDTVNNASRFLSSEVPSSLSSFANAVPASQSLPNSFYRSTKPSWWGSMPWPAIGPDVTGGNVAGVGGHVYLIPAADCYLNHMGGPADGSGSVLSFNASSCYGAGAAGGGTGGGTTPPAPPSSLNAVVN